MKTANSSVSMVPDVFLSIPAAARISITSLVFILKSFASVLIFICLGLVAMLSFLSSVYITADEFRKIFIGNAHTGGKGFSNCLPQCFFRNIREMQFRMVICATIGNFLFCVIGNTIRTDDQKNLILSDRVADEIRPRNNFSRFSGETDRKKQLFYIFIFVHKEFLSISISRF